MTEIEIAGDVVTGAAIARAIEPAHGQAGATGEKCLNCGTLISGSYCHHCGQKADVHRTLAAFWHDFLHSILHFEGKIWRTLPMLALRPGELTRRYVHGERARFVSPLALFLFSVFLMFAVFNLVGGPFRADADASAIRREATREGKLVATRIAGLESRRQQAVASGRPTASIDRELEELRQEEKILTASRPIVLVPNASSKPNSEVVDLRDAKLETGWGRLDHAFLKARDNPTLLIYKMQANAYKFSWALVLLSLPFVWLIFAWKRELHLFDHLVFVSYSLCFVSLLLVFLAMIAAIGLGGLAPLFIIAGVPLHLFVQLRGAYALGIGGAIWRTAFLLLAAVVVIVVFALLLLAMGAF